MKICLSTNRNLYHYLYLCVFACAESFCRAGISPDRPVESPGTPEAEPMDTLAPLHDDFSRVEALYKKHIAPLQFDSSDIARKLLFSSIFSPIFRYEYECLQSTPGACFTKAFMR
jgi:hypothetical protein